jgi:manganese/zinc/iron transport system ATP- binding protein
MKYALNVSTLSFRTKRKTILENINLKIPEGVVCAVIGPNGAGKTTLIKSILDIYKPQSGSIKILEQDVHKALRSHVVGYIPEKENLPKYKVVD